MSATQKLLRFGVFELNLDAEELRKDGTPIKLPPQPVKILALLASRAGQVVTRDEIQKEIWGDETYVDFEHGLNQCIKQIRTALNDNADKPLYVETIPRRGYRFLAPVVSKTFATPAPRVTESSSGIVSRVSLPPAPQTVVIVEADAAAKMPASSSAPDQEAQLPIGDPIAAPGAAVLVSEAELPAVDRSGPRVKRSVVAWAAVVTVAVIAGGLYWRSQKAYALREQDTIVLADFANSTGDPVFDDALKQALAIQLEQSPFLNVLSERKVGATLKLMNVSLDVPVTKKVAEEICLRTNSNAVIAGSIVPNGEHYWIGVNALNCHTGDTIASVETEAANRTGLLRALDRVGSEMRGKLGESVASVQKFNQPLEQVTTPSFEALQAFSRAARISAYKGHGEALPYLKLALELDPNFAIAYLQLGIFYHNLREPSLAHQNVEKAYQLRDRVSQRERYSIEAEYYTIVTRQIDKAIQTFTEWGQNYPGDLLPRGNLGYLYAALGQYEKALDETKEYLRAIPDNALAYSNLAGFYIFLGRFDEARVAVEEARQRKLDYPRLRNDRYLVAFFLNDHAAMQEELEAAIGKPGTEDQLLATDANTRAFHGRMEDARALAQRAVDSAKRADEIETAAGWRTNAALLEAEVGNISSAQKMASEALALSRDPDVEAKVALAFARTGAGVEAAKLADKLNDELPLGTMMQNYTLPTIRAAIELQKNNPQKAIDILETARPYELGQESLDYLYPVYVRGECYLSLGEPEKAAGEFEKIITHRGIVENFVFGSLVHLQKARAKAMSGDTDAARKFYSEYFALWKDGDPATPILKRAQAEYLRLP